MRITIEELLDYLECGMRYKHRYIDDTESENARSSHEVFNQEIHRIAYHIFNYIQDEKYPSEYLLRQKWGKIWCKDKTVTDLLNQSFEMKNPSRHGHNFHKKLERLGTQAIANLHPHFKENPGLPILVGKRMNVKVGRHTVSVTLDLIREVKVDGKDIIELVDFKTGLKVKNRHDAHPINLHINHDIEVTAASLGFRQLTGEKEDRIVYYDMINNREYMTKRDDNQYKTLENILDHVERALEAGIFFPVMNDRCNECPFQINCNQENWYRD